MNCCLIVVVDCCHAVVVNCCHAVLVDPDPDNVAVSGSKPAHVSFEDPKPSQRLLFSSETS